MNVKERTRIIQTEITALYLAYKDRRTSWFPKMLIIVTVAYALSPVDLIPDFIPVLGYLDDLIILPLLIGLSIKLIPADVMADCRKRAKEQTGISSKTGIYAAIFIILLWIVLALLIWHKLSVTPKADKVNAKLLLIFSKRIFINFDYSIKQS